MSRFFKPYEGNKPFLFISYSHRQSDQVVDSIRILHEQGWRLWYDEGIPAGSDWPSNIARHMEACGAVLFFLSGTALESPNCLSEIRTAARLRKPILVLRLEDAEAGEQWDVLPPKEKHLTAAETPEGNADLILQSGFLKRRFHHHWTEHIPWRALGLAASLLFFLSAAGAFAALAWSFYVSDFSLPRSRRGDGRRFRRRNCRYRPRPRLPPPRHRRRHRPRLSISAETNASLRSAFPTASRSGRYVPRCRCRRERFRPGTWPSSPRSSSAGTWSAKT